MTPNLLNMSRQKTKLYRSKQINPTQHNTECYKTLNNEYNKTKTG